MVHAKYWEIIADNLKKRGWSLGWVSAADSRGRTIFVANAHHVTISPGNSQTKCCSGLSKRLAEDGITIRKNSSILGFSSNPTKKVNSK
jgi:lambda repressor-like predicted transcriptional regulator